MSSGTDANANGGSAGRASAELPGVLSPPSVSSPIPRSSTDSARDPGPRDGESVEAQLERVKQEKEHLNHQYRSLLSKLTAMRQSLGDKLKEDAEELDRRELQIAELEDEKQTLAARCKELEAEAEERSDAAANDDLMGLTDEMRELRGELEKLRAEKEEWEQECSHERQRREQLEDDVRGFEIAQREAQADAERAIKDCHAEKERAANLQEVLEEFQQAKDSELRQATSELEAQLKLAATQLSEYKLRAANAESSLSQATTNATKSSALEKELKDKNALIAKLRHDAVVNNEHLTEALRRLRKSTSDVNVDRRLVTNVLLSFLTTSRADSKRFEMLQLLSTILQWDDAEREKAGLQRQAKRPQQRRKSSSKEATGLNQDEMNESFSNLFVEFLLKEATQGQEDHLPTSPSSRLMSPGASSGALSPPTSGAATPVGYSRSRALSNSSSASGTPATSGSFSIFGAPPGSGASTGTAGGSGLGLFRGNSNQSLDQMVRPQGARKPSQGLMEVMK